VKKIQEQIVAKGKSSQKETIKIKSSSKKEPQTMEDLFSKFSPKMVDLKRGDRIRAKIIRISKNEILSDIGAKSYGIIIGREFELIKDLLDNFKVGDIVEAEVIIPEMEGGETLISLRKNAVGRLWENLANFKNEGKEIAVLGVKAVSGGLLVDCFGLRGFIPQTQLDPDFIESPENLVEKEIAVKILEINQKQNRLVLSQKEVTQKEELYKRRKAITHYKAGLKVEAKIIGVDKYGLYAEVEKNGIKASGFVHISEISWERVDDLSTLFKEGEIIKAEIVSLDEQEGRLNLSIKQLLADPWLKIGEKYKEEKTVAGTVVKTSSLGVFVELEKGVEGLLHISKIPVGKEFKVGDKIPVTIEKMDISSRKISLSYVSSTKPIGYR